MGSLLAALQKVNDVLGAGRDTLEAFPAVVEALREVLPVASARLVLARGPVAGSTAAGSPLTFTIGTHGFLEVALVAPLAPEQHELALAAAQSLALALDRDEALAAARSLRHRFEEILATVCHDLRSPLGTIFLSVGLLERAREKQRLPERLPRDLAAIRAGAEQVERFLEDLVELRRMEAGKLPLTPTPEDVSALVSDAMAKGLLATLARRGLQLETAIAPGLPLVLADRARILRVLGRLVEHLARGAPRGSKMALGAAADPHGNVELVVEAPAPFESDGVLGEGRAAGAGFGLEIAARIARDHGGELRASHGGGLARLAFTLPRASAEREAA